MAQHNFKNCFAGGIKQACREFKSGNQGSEHKVIYHQERAGNRKESNQEQKKTIENLNKQVGE